MDATTLREKHAKSKRLKAFLCHRLGARYPSPYSRLLGQPHFCTRISTAITLVVAVCFTVIQIIAAVVTFIQMACVLVNALHMVHVVVPVLQMVAVMDTLVITVLSTRGYVPSGLYGKCIDIAEGQD